MGKQPMPSKRWLKKVAYLNSRANTCHGRRFFKRHPELLKEGMMYERKSDSQRLDVNFNNPDTFGIKQLPPLIEEVSRVDDEVQYTTLTNREAIAALIRKLTYRELKQIADELLKSNSSYANDHIDIAQTLDDWAYMVKGEDEQIENWKGYVNK